jgi:heme/copper-type cytochrome/quinol oxidase subunit 2
MTVSSITTLLIAISLTIIDDVSGAKVRSNVSPEDKKAEEESYSISFFIMSALIPYLIVMSCIMFFYFYFCRRRQADPEDSCC